MKRHIVISDPDRQNARLLKALLSKAGYELSYSADPAICRAEISANPPDILITDPLYPSSDGRRLIKAALDAGCGAVIAVSAAAGERAVTDVLDAGADDYLPKPFATSEFLARVRALTRRSNTYAASVLSFGNVTLDCSQYLLKTILGEVRLNNKEYQLMELFLRHPRQVFSSEHLMEKVWGLDSEADMDVVWTYIGFLRRKLRQIGADIEIRTIRGAGYALEEMPC